jgi:2-dehydro-3-deoxyphosphooctonate aldolase (KDO 8-P synthase)
MSKIKAVPQELTKLFTDENLFLVAGPCVVESREIIFKTAEAIKRICQDLQVPLFFKSSYKKANRSSLHSFTGIGDEKALKILDELRQEMGLQVVTDIHSVEEAAIAANYVDVLQIPAFLCRQTELLVAAGRTGKSVLVKKGQFMSPEAMRFAVDKIKSVGNAQVALIERGSTFGYTDLVVDFRSIVKMQAFDVPVIMDCTHSLQQPNQVQGVTGGQPEFIETIARAAVAVGADGLFIETHPDPASAMSDGANMLPLDKLRPLLEKVLRIRKSLKDD